MANEKAVYRVRTGSGSGTSFFIEGAPYLVTNYHVVAGYRHVSVGRANDATRAEVVLVSPGKDLAFLKVAGLSGVTGLETQGAEPVKKQNRVAAMGYALGMPFTITEGIVSSENQLVDGTRYIQTDTAVNPGNSGGPLVDASGKVIGVVTCKITSAENVGYAMPIAAVEEELRELAKNPPGGYSVRCVSCNVRMGQPDEYCPDCGIQIPASFFAELPLSKLGVFVEGALVQCKLDPIAARSGGNFWELHSGSAKVRIFYNGTGFLIATSPLVKLPQGNVAKVLEYVLGFDEPPFFLSVSDSMIYLSYRLHMSDVTASNRGAELQKKLAGFLGRADEMDNFLVKEFGCTPTEESGLSDSA